MKIKNLIESLSSLSQYVKKIEEMRDDEFSGRRFSESGIRVVRVNLRSGWILSIATGGRTFSDEHTFEVAVMDSNGINYEITDGGVLENQYLENIKGLIKKLSSIST